MSRRVTLVGLAASVLLVGGGALAATLPGEPPGPLTPPAFAPQPAPPAPSPTAGPSVGAGAAPEPTAPPVDPSPAATGASPSASPTSSPVVRRWEAEEAELSGFVRIFPMADASGGAVVGMIGMHDDSHVRFPRIPIEVAGEYELTLHYVSQLDREAALVVNDGEPVTVRFPGLRTGRELGQVRVTVELAAGDNELWFGNSATRAPALDLITITG